MALPTTRDITLAPGTEIPSTLLNNLQDMIIGGRHGPKRRVTSASFGHGEFFDSSTVPTKWNMLVPGLTVSLDSTTQGEFQIPCALAVGETLNDLFATVSSITNGDILDMSAVNDLVLFGVAVPHAIVAGGARERVQLDLAGGPFLIDLVQNFGAYIASRATNTSRAVVYSIDYEVEF